MVYRIFFSVWTLLVFTGCVKTLNDKLYSKIKKDCETLDSCIIEIEDVTDFKWDTMYVVFPNATPEELEKVFGAAGISFWDESMNLIFYENGSIVYNEASEFNVLSDTRLKSGWSANSSYESRFLRNKLPNYCRSMWLLLLKMIVLL